MKKKNVITVTFAIKRARMKLFMVVLWLFMTRLRVKALSSLFCNIINVI
jgi:hypothetical protein